METTKKRYVTVLFCKLFNLICSVCTAGLVPRALGVGQYGDFQFLKSAFTEIKSFTDLSVSSALFDWSSKNQKSTLSVMLFVLWEGFQNILLFSIVGISWFFGWSDKFWPNQDIYLIISMVIVVGLTSIETQFLSFADTKAFSARTQILKLVGIVLLTVSVLVTYYFDKLNLNSFILINWITTLVVLVLLLISLFRVRKSFLLADLSIIKFQDAKEKIVNFASPLVIYTIFGVAVAYFSRWLLNVMGGREEYGAYALAFNWSQLVMVFTIALRPIFWREASTDFAEGKIDSLASKYKSFCFILFALNMYFAAFICVQADFLAVKVAGDSFQGAIVPLMILSIYPAHQALGQCTSVVFFATERTKQYKNIGVLGLIITPILSWFILAPKSGIVPGLDLGAVGYSLLTIGLQFLIVNMMVFKNCQFLKISFKDMILCQLQISVITLLLSLICKYSFSALFSSLNLFLVSGVSYTIVFTIVLWKFPRLIGFTKAELMSGKAWLKEKFVNIG